MSFHRDSCYSKEYKSALLMAQKGARFMTERFNEPAHILEGPKEYVVVRGLSWDYRTEWGLEGYPKWIQDDPDGVLVETVYPVDKLALNRKKAAGTKGRLTTALRKVRWDIPFEIEELFRDYPEVRQMTRLLQSAMEHAEAVAVNLGFEIDKALAEHKRDGHKKGAPDA